MKYLILIKLSKRFISFRYFIKGNDRPTYLGDPIMPLAIYCNGTEIEFSKVARQEAKKNTPCYYDDVFSFMQQGGSFMFKGTQEPSNKILLLAIEQKLKELLLKKCYGEFGGIEDNRQKLPVVFLFEPDLDNGDKNFILRLFKNAGYGRVKGLDDGPFILEYGKKVASFQNYAIVTCCESQLFGRLYDNMGKCLSSFTEIGRIEVNPKEQRLCELIFKDIMYQAGMGYTYENELSIILDKVKKLKNTRPFQTGKGYFQDKITLSDGEQWSFAVEASEIANAAANSVNAKKTELFFKEHKCNANNCAVVVSASNEQLDELYDTFNGAYSTIKVDSENVYDDMILSTISKPWVPEPISIDPISDPDPPIRTGPGGIIGDGPSINPQKEKELVRKGKMMIRSYQNRADLPNVERELGELISDLRYIGSQDGILKDLDAALVTVKKKMDAGVLPPPPPPPPPPPSHLTRQAKMLLNSYQKRGNLQNVKSELETLISQLKAYDDIQILRNLNGALEWVKDKLGRSDPSKYSKEVMLLKRTVRYLPPNEVRTKIDDLLARMHADGVHDYDSDLNALKPTAAPPRSSPNSGRGPKPPRRSAPESPIQPKPKQLSPIEQKKLGREVKMAIHKTGVTKKDLLDLLRKTHEAGVHDYDTDLNAAIGRAK